VVVSGGAIGGAAAALLFARAGARVTLCERVAEPRALGAGIGLADNGLAVLEALGLLGALAAQARPVAAARIVDGARRPIFAPPGPAPRLWTLRRADLHGVLLDAVAAEPGIAAHYGVEVERATNDGRVWVREATGGARELAADLVIGADGVASRVRDGGRFGAVVHPPGIQYLRVLVDGGAALGEEAWTAAGLFGSFAVAGGAYVYASAGSPATRAALAAGDLAALCDAWRDAYPAATPLLAGIARFDDLLLHPVRRVDCERWVDGRLVLLGDAAHAMAPNLGQGANSALVDAAVLLDELRRAPELAAGLAAYEHRRRPAVRYVAAAAARLGALAEWRRPWARWFRDRLLMPLAARLTRPGDLDRVLQERRDTLLEIGRRVGG
jgi:2-polyprenyl-6-methoxyphenol hydroxylase-like FAD-dependent oxidoreductase